jgi:hypothetical protein
LRSILEFADDDTALDLLTQIRPSRHWQILQKLQPTRPKKKLTPRNRRDEGREGEGDLSTASIGVKKAVNAVEFSISWFGNTNAPTLTGPPGCPFLPSATMTLKKCVGTATEGGSPMTS